MGLSHVAFTWACVGCFGGTMMSAVVPWMSAEILMLSLPALTPSPYELAGLVVVGTIGQMAGKCILYWAARRRPAVLTGTGRAAGLVRWGSRFMDRPGRATGFVLLSSCLGLPPFFATTLLAGAMQMKFSTFIAAGTAGRLFHFSVLVWAGATGWGGVG
jgi:membrane protein YqaA with SNARE-associated domain